MSSGLDAARGDPLVSDDLMMMTSLQSHSHVPRVDMVSRQQGMLT